MKTRIVSLKSLLITVGLLFAGMIAFAQQPAMQYFRYYDQRGINVFETTKDDTVGYDGLKLRIGAGFTQGYQNLKHSNGQPLPPPVTTPPTPVLFELGGGFPLAQANFNIDVQLYDGVSLNLVSYMSSHHHNEFWVKGGYLQIDKVTFLNSEFFDKLWKNLTLKVGHMEVNFGDAHFRRSDGGHTLWNPWIENNIMDEFTTEIGAELYYKNKGITAMFGFTDGEIQGNVNAPSAPDGAQRKPSLYGKLAFDRQLKDNLRVRLSGSAMTTKSSANNTLFSGDRTGSNYQYVMDNAPVSLTGNFTSGRFNPGYRDNVTAFMVNPFVKFGGLEVFGTWLYAFGKNQLENGEVTSGTPWGSTDFTNRQSHQGSGEALYRFGKAEKFYVGARYTQVSSSLAEGQSAASPGSLYDVKIDRTAIAAGWFITRNILLKGEYVTQNYDGFLPTGPNNRFYQGKFNGFVVQGAISF